MGSLNDINVKDLLSRYAGGECTEAEKALVERWYLQFNEKKEVDISEERIEELGKKIFGALSKDADVRTKKLWSPRGAAAAAIFASLLGVALWFRPFDGAVVRKAEHAAALRDAVLAGKSVLKLANGRIINITDAANGLLASQAGLEVIKISDQKIQYKVTGPVELSDAAALNTISTPRGAQMEISLSDDTKVWLNAATTLIFPIVFADLKQRSLSLSGEAYFEVFKDKSHPFVVSARNQMTEVLGTHFNISAYNDETSARTTLLEGSIKVSGLSGRGTVVSSIVLKPNQQAVCTTGMITVLPVDPEEAIAWKNGEFVFRNEALENIMLKMARWYDVEVVYEDKQVAKQLFGGSISRQTGIREFLNMLEMTGDVRFQIKGKKVTVSK
jgi:transmembrane sensor